MYSEWSYIVSSLVSVWIYHYFNFVQKLADYSINCNPIPKPWHFGCCLWEIRIPFIVERNWSTRIFMLKFMLWITRNCNGMQRVSEVAPLSEVTSLSLLSLFRNCHSPLFSLNFRNFLCSFLPLEKTTYCLKCLFWSKICCDLMKNFLSRRIFFSIKCIPEAINLHYRPNSVTLE